jgi:hypothetical protein
MGAVASIIVTLLPRFGWLRVIANTAKSVAERILQSFNNLETNAGVVLGIGCQSQDREAAPVQLQRVALNWSLGVSANEPE